jgi:hypothetical protein
MKMKRLLLFVLMLMGISFGAHAQNPIRIPACGTASPPPGASNPYMDSTGELCVAATVNATATTTATASATPTAVSAGTGIPLNLNLFSALFEQPTFGGTPVDGTHGLPVNCILGCAGGTFNNNTDGVATSSTNGQAAAWLYGWNGTTWDRLEDDAAKNLKVNVAAGSVSSTAAPVIGFGRLAVTSASAPLSTLTIGPNSGGWPTTPAQVYVINSSASAGIAYVCPLGGTCGPTTGIPLQAGAAYGFYKPSTTATVVADSTATVVAQW